MRIFLADLGHNQLTISSDVYPLGIANLAAYVQAYCVATKPLEITLFREPQDLKRFCSLKTTNCLESLLSQVGQLTDRVDRWRTSDQKHRWVASALLAIEPRLRRIKAYRHLPQLQAALQRELQRESVTEARIA